MKVDFDYDFDFDVWLWLWINTKDDAKLQIASDLEISVYLTETVRLKLTQNNDIINQQCSN